MASLYNDPKRFHAFKSINFFRIVEWHFCLFWKYDMDGDDREETEEFPILTSREYLSLDEGEDSHQEYVRVACRPTEAEPAALGGDAPYEYHADLEIVTNINKSLGERLNDMTYLLVDEFLSKYLNSQESFDNLVLAVLKNGSTPENSGILEDIALDFGLEDGGGKTVLDKARLLLNASDFRVWATDGRQYYDLPPSEQNRQNKGIIIVQPIAIRF